MPDVRIVDLTHEVTPFSILDGARFLYGATPYYPTGTVFVVVIDPTVGSTRKAIVAKSKRGQYFVLPDNGLLTLVEQRDGIDGVREITNPDCGLDDWNEDVLDFSWAGHFFSGGSACGAWGRVEKGGAGGASGVAGAFGVEGSACG
ncbi:MAG: SAM-dependent chlorinase/fluorinase [Candidatus Sulfotelmatobacter sp.]